MIKKGRRESNFPNMRQEVLFAPLQNWLESKGYYSLVTHGRKEVGMWIGDLFPSKVYIEPDLVGVRYRQIGTRSWTDMICIEGIKVNGLSIYGLGILDQRG